MFGRFVRSVAEIAVLLFAAYAFFRVPIGKKTSWEHLVAIFSTEPAREAVRDYKAAGEELRDEIVQRVGLGAGPNDKDAGLPIDASAPEAGAKSSTESPQNEPTR